ncbi:MAG: SH3 domain-containing protein, partial [Leptonema sp. (in: Bacteria)]|nr:SH3 domain-containing protein [Leptonema sp. (in: bacteria)]
MSRFIERQLIRFMIILTLVMIISCRPTVGPFAPDYYYVTTISGLSVRDKAGLTGKMIDILALNEPVQIVEKEPNLSKVSNRLGYWVKIQYSQNQNNQVLEKEGWVFDVYLHHQPIERFFKVKPLGGIEMRELPDLRAKVLNQLPYSTIGLIETASRRIDAIRGRRGYWFRTTFNDQVGWLFSGLVTTSLHRHELEREESLDLKEADLEITNRSLDDLLANAKSIQVFDGPDYRVHVLSYFLRDHELCDGPESRLVFERHRDGELFITN